ncbi:MAG: stalk domain-containing protein, partial [Armatimonadota bacterium]
MMQLQHRTCRLALAACLLIAGSWAGGVWAQSVVINGVQLITSHPPMTMAGSMLLPMRDVFEALNSDVKWRESDQRITATRGAIEIELWIGKTSALVNGQQRLLPIAPMLVNGSTYVPLRFPAEAFGGSVEWDAAARTALINIPPAQDAPAVPQLPAIPQPVVNPEPVANPQPVVQQPTTAEGTVIQLVQAPAGIVLQDADTGGLEAVQVSQNTVITRGVVGDVPQPVALGEARIGDYAQAVLAQGNLAARVVLTYGQVEGKIVAIAGNTLVLDDGTAFHLSESVRVFDPMGQPLALTAVTQNTPGQVVFEPHSKIVYELRLRAQPEPPQQQAPPQILTVGLLNNTTFFRRGDVLKLQLRGTPGGQAVVSIERLVDNLPLGEVQPGVYEGAYTISARDDWRGLAIAGDLTVGGVPAETVVPQTRVVIDNTPPTIAGMSPTDGSLVPNSSPIIGLAFRAGGEAPIDLRSARLWVNGRDVSNGLQVYADEMD